MAAQSVIRIPLLEPLSRIVDGEKVRSLLTPETHTPVSLPVDPKLILQQDSHSPQNGLSLYYQWARFQYYHSIPPCSRLSGTHSTLQVKTVAYMNSETD